MRLIYAEDLIQDSEDILTWEMLARINRAETIDAEPLRHGHWILRHVGVGHFWECSVCRTNPCLYVTSDTNYCPHCGAKMDEVSK